MVLRFFWGLLAIVVCALVLAIFRVAVMLNVDAEREDYNGRDFWLISLMKTRSKCEQLPFPPICRGS
jgi:hypothetical protein